MKKYFIVLGISFIAQASIAAPLSAIMTFESMTMTADGVKKQTHFQEFLNNVKVLLLVCALLKVRLVVILVAAALQMV